MILNASQLDEIEGKAKAATPGPWEQCPHVLSFVDDANGKTIADTDQDRNNPGGLDQCLANAVFIGSANPSVVLQLVAMARRAERMRELLDIVDGHIFHSDYQLDTDTSRAISAILKETE